MKNNTYDVYGKNNNIKIKTEINANNTNININVSDQNNKNNKNPPNKKSKFRDNIFNGILILLVSNIFVLGETIYFGSNLLPSSVPEVMCDAISIIGVFIGGVIIYDAIYEYYYKK
jgi:hypothetical protein